MNTLTFCWVLVDCGDLQVGLVAAAVLGLGDQIVAVIL